MAYTIHTTAKPTWHKLLNYDRSGYLTPTDHGDCFYGWGEPRNSRQCLRHTTIPNVTLAVAREIAARLVGDGYQAVITDADDYSRIITGPDTPIHYRASHQH